VVFWVVTWYSLVDGYWLVRGMCYLHHQCHLGPNASSLKM